RRHTGRKPQSECQTLEQGVLGLATVTRISVTKPGRLAALLAFVVACGSPAPVATPPTVTTPTEAPRTTQSATAQPVAVATLPLKPPAAIARQVTYPDARQLFVEGDYLNAADKLRPLLSDLQVAAEARFELALSLALAGQGQAALQTLSSGADPRDSFVRGIALDAANQHAQAMSSLVDYAA